MRKLMLTTLALAAPFSAQATAQQPDPEPVIVRHGYSETLPPDPAVHAALDSHPSVIAAQARVESARAQARALGEGPHEFIVSGGIDRRDVDMEGSYSEYNAQVSRAIRLPGKARLDRQSGEYGIVVAENIAEDAKHQAAVLLNTYWWDWLGAAAQAGVDRQAVINYERAADALERRVELRDAAQLDVDQANAALASARTQAQLSAGRAELARTRLAAQFPPVPLSESPPAVPVPVILEPDLETLGRLVVANSHEIAAAEAEAQRLATSAVRNRRDRIADPSVGLRVFSERGGAEQGAGIVFSMPLGGGHRRAIADQSAAEASAAQSEAQLARYMVGETAGADVAEARFRFAAWQQSRASLEAQMTALAKQRRGHELGEIDLNDLLIGERLVHDAFRAETEARTEAMRSITKLMIDAHALWLGD